MRTRGQRARICATMPRDLLDRAGAWRRCSSAAAWPPAGGRRRRRRAAGSSSSRSSRGRTGPPGGRAADRRWRRGRGRSASGGVRCASRNSSTNSRSIAGAVMADLVVARRRLRRRMLEPVERGLAGQRRAVRAPRLELAGQRSPAPGRGAARRGRSGPRSPARCRTPAGRPGSRPRARSAPAARSSVKQAANRPTSPIARSVAPSSSAPASEVIAPPSNAATTARPSTGANSNRSRYTLSASGNSSASR